MNSLTKLAENLLFDITNKSESTFGNIQTGFPRFDLQTGGIPVGDLVLVASHQIELCRSLALSIISNSRAAEKLEVLYFSTMLSSDQLTKMLICNQLKLEFLQVQKGDLTEKHQDEIDEFSKDMYVYFDDSMNLSIDSICETLESRKSGNKQLVILDNLNYFDKNNPDIEDKLFNLKQIARKYNLSVIALYENNVDLSKNNKDSAKESAITSLNFSTKPVDIQCLIYRPEYYGIIENEKGESTIGLTKMNLYYQKELLNQLDLVYKREYFLLNSIH